MQRGGMFPTVVPVLKSSHDPSAPVGMTSVGWGTWGHCLETFVSHVTVEVLHPSSLDGFRMTGRGVPVARDRRVNQKQVDTSHRSR